MKLMAVLLLALASTALPPPQRASQWLRARYPEITARPIGGEDQFPLFKNPVYVSVASLVISPDRLVSAIAVRISENSPAFCVYSEGAVNIRVNEISPDYATRLVAPTLIEGGLGNILVVPPGTSRLIALYDDAEVSPDTSEKIFGVPATIFRLRFAVWPAQEGIDESKRCASKPAAFDTWKANPNAEPKNLLILN